MPRPAPSEPARVPAPGYYWVRYKGWGGINSSLMVLLLPAGAS